MVIISILYSHRLKELMQRQGCISMVECSPNIHKVLGLIPTTTHKKSSYTESS